MSEQKHEQQMAQELLSNQAFLRLARGFDTYQELLLEAKDEKEKNQYLNLNIIPTSLKSAELLGKVWEGFSLLAKEMKSGKLQEVKKISMVSWLLGKNFEEKLKIIFDDLVNDIVEIDRTEREAEEGASILAVQYNRRSLVDYLKTGKLPEIRKLVMTKEEFLNMFLNE